MSEPATNPWDRRKGESAQAYGRFTRYCQQPSGSRSMRQIAEEDGVHPRVIERVGSRNKWVERAGAYDVSLATTALTESARIARVREIEEYRARARQESIDLGRLASYLMGEVEKRLPLLFKRTLTLADATRVMTLAVRCRQASLDAEAQAIGADRILAHIEDLGA